MVQEDDLHDREADADLEDDPLMANKLQPFRDRSMIDASTRSTREMPDPGIPTWEGPSPSCFSPASLPATISQVESTTASTSTSILRSDSSPVPALGSPPILDDPITSDIDWKDLNALLAQELNTLTIQERETVYEEIHAVEQHVEETPEFLAQKLEAMSMALEQVKDKPPAYQLAMNQNAAYVHSRELGLMMLRSVDFDPAQAAEKLLKFLTGKCDMFGPQCLCRSVFMDEDMSEDDIHCLKSGPFQYLSTRDSNGRAVSVDLRCIISESKKHKEPENLLKALAYMHLAAAEDVETQKRGIVGVTYCIGKFVEELNSESIQRSAQVMKWVPVRVLGFHICFNDPRLRSAAPTNTRAMGKDLRIRHRLHEGTHEEVQNSLMTFGVPVGVLPVTYQGEVKSQNHGKWLRRRQAKEQQLYLQQSRSKDGGTGFTSTTAVAGIDLPPRGDVLLQRGRHFQENPGNRLMHQMIVLCVDQYDQANTIKGKKEVATRVVDAIHARGARFLERNDDGWWIVVPKTEALKRVAKAIRTARETKIANPDQTSSFFSTSGNNASKRSKLSGTKDKI